MHPSGFVDGSLEIAPLLVTPAVVITHHDQGHPEGRIHLGTWFWRVRACNCGSSTEAYGRHGNQRGSWEFTSKPQAPSRQNKLETSEDFLSQRLPLVTRVHSHSMLHKPNLPKQLHQPGGQAFKCPRLWGTYLVQTLMVHTEESQVTKEKQTN